MFNISDVLESIDKTEMDSSKLVFKFFEKYPNPDQFTIDKFLKNENLSIIQFLCLSYKLINSFASYGRFNESGKSLIDFDKDQLLKGIKVEKEHSECLIIARRIALDHLSECPDYYDRLEKMERDCE